MNWKTYEDLKKWGISQRLQDFGGNVSKAAESLDITDKTIYNVLGTKKIQKIRSDFERAGKKAN